MAQPYKGQRKQVATRLLQSEANEVERRAQESGTTVSEYLRTLVLADLANPHTEAKQEALRFEMAE